MSLRKILGAAFLFSVALYAALVFVLLGRPGVPSVDEATLKLLTMVVYLAAAICLLTALVLMRRLKMPNVFVIAYALAEAPALLGLVHALLTRSQKDFYLLAGSSAIFIIYFMFREN